MLGALARRQSILEVLSDRRNETIMNLANEFGVTERTIRKDIQVLSCSAPVFTIQGNGGGVRVADGYYIGCRYLKSHQEALLRKLANTLQGEELATLQSILTAFAMTLPKGAKKR